MRFLFLFFALAAVAMADDQAVDDFLTKANDQFTAKFFNEVAKANEGKSVILSAFSVLQPLSQLELASVGPSHDELQNSLGFPNDTIIKSVFPLVNTRLKAVKGVELKQASRIYIPQDAELNEEYATLSKEVFSSDVKKVDFSENIEAAKEINAFVESETNNRIKDLVDPSSIDASTRAVLVNALYFKGSWKNKFESSLTKDKDFHVTKDKTIKVPMMYKHDDFKYGESTELDAKLLEIAYEGDESSLLVVLPNKIDGIDNLIEKLKDPSALAEASKNLYSTTVDVSLPKFKIETKTNLKDILIRMGITKLFSPTEAKLDKLLKGESDLYVSNAVQKAFIEVNEEGAEAAAANEFGIAYLSAIVPPEPLHFVADHPFFFALKDGNNILFNGIYQF